MTMEVPRQRALPRLLCLQASRQASGIVVASRGKLKRIFCLEAGWIAFAASNLVEEQFVEVLVRKDLLDPARHADLVNEAARTRKKVVEILLASGSPSADALRRTMEELVHELLTSSLEWPDGTVTFEAGLPQLDREVTVRLGVLPLVLGHARRYPPSVEALRVRIGPPDLRPIPTADAAQILGAAELDPAARYLIEACDGGRDLGDLVAESPLPEEPTLRAVLGLLLAGILEPADAVVRSRAVAAASGATASGAAPATPLTREECIACLTSASAKDHYGVLGLERLAPADQVRGAYYALARRYHPDRFRSGSLQDLLGRFEEYFSKVTEAYNTLSEPLRRREYDDSLVAGVETAGPKVSETAQIARQNFLRGRALAQVRKLNDAVTFLENAAKLEPGNADYNLEAGLLLGRNPRRRADAERYLLRAAEIAPANVRPYLALGQIYVRAGHAGPAARMLREVLRWDPNNVEAKRLLDSLGPVPDQPSGASTPRPVFKS